MDKIIEDKILNQVVNPNKSNFNFCKGKVVNYDVTRNRCDIIVNIKNVGDLQLENVPMQTNGFISNDIKKGDLVDVMFLNNSPLLPKIIGRCDEGYELFTRKSYMHLEQSCIINNVHNIDIQEKEELSNSWIDEDNVDIGTYYDWINFSLEDNAKNLLNSLGYYNEGDVGFTNPNNKSTVKVDKDGNIIIFTDTNGIVINKNNNTIDVYGDINIKCSSININTKSLKINGKEVINNGF